MADNPRSLTAGEQHLAREIFGSAINYATVKVHNGRYIFFQPSDTAMTPNGEIYFPAKVYKDDFSTNISDSQWLIHELTHVWQYQHGTDVVARAIFNRNYDYGRLDGTRTFADFGVEQQAAITADYYLQKHGGTPYHGTGDLRAYERIIPFLPGR